MRFKEMQLCFSAENEDVAYALRRRMASWLRPVLRASAVVLSAVTIAGVATNSAPIWWIYGAFALVLGIAFTLDGANRTREAGLVLSVGFWIAATAAVFFMGGVRSPGSFVYLPIILTAGLFCSWRAASVLAFASFGAVLLAASLEALDYLPPPLRAPTVTRLLPVFAGSLAMTAVLVGIALKTLQGALQDVRQHTLHAEDLLLNVPDVLAVIDRLGTIVAAGRTMHERLGYEPSELVGKHISRVELFDSDGRSIIDDVRLLGARASEGARELALRCKDGARSWGEVRLQSVPIGTKGGTLRRVVLYDVTPRHAAKTRQAELEKRIEQAGRLEKMGLLAGGVAHDFNNQLTVILSLGSILDAQLAANSTQRRLLAEINQSAVRAAELVRDLLAARTPTTVETIDLGRELAAFEPMLSHLIGDGITLSFRTEGAPCFVQMARTDLERIATNLVINARDAMPSGGEIVLAVAPSTPSDERPFARRMVELSVTDCGIGMDSLTRQRILEPFYTTKGTAGTGLGLSAVDGIVSRLGGQLLIESEPERGTKIRVLLPEADSESITPVTTVPCGARADSEVLSPPSIVCGTRPE